MCNYIMCKQQCIHLNWNAHHHLSLGQVVTFLQCSTVKDYWSQITITNSEKVWNTGRITKVWHRDQLWANAVGKMASIDLSDANLPHTFNLKSAVSSGTPRVVHWLRPCTSNAGSILCWRTKIPHAQQHGGKKKKKITHSIFEVQ